MATAKQALVDDIKECFSIVRDPRVDRTKLHPMMSIIVLTILAVICGAEGFAEVEVFGLARVEWLKTFLDLPNGIPSHDTIGRLFAALNTQELAEAFRNWMASIAQLTRGEVVALDGKTLRRAIRQGESKSFIHMVSAFAANNQVVLAQVKTDEKSNEITAIPRLLDMLDIKNSVVTIDAMGCQKEITKKVTEREADYLIAVKGNQPKLEQDLVGYFDMIRNDKEFGSLAAFHETHDRGHGRTETRRVWTIKDVSWLPQRSDWSNLNSAAMVESERTVGGTTSVECRYYISSLTKPDPRRVAEAVRSHWEIENVVHWSLDVTFHEDQCRVRVGNAAANLSIIRHMVLNLLKSETTSKASLRMKRKKAGWDNDYLLKILVGG